MTFTLQTTEGALRCPEDFQKNWTLLFYYTGDFLPVSATELLELAELQPEFSARRCQIIAVSCDSIAVHLAFLETLSRYRLNRRPHRTVAFPLGSDCERILQTELKLEPKKKYLWLIAPGGDIQAHFSYPGDTGANFTEALRTLCALQTGKPTPCGWVPGAPALVLPPATRSESRDSMSAWEREGKICLDWYLCFDPD